VVPPKLDYERPRRQSELVGGEASASWKQFNALLLMCVGLVPLTVGVYGLVTTITRWPQSWLTGSFVTFVGLLAGCVFTVRPVYRLVRGRTWWTIE
jgi:hypothetical protein